MSGHEAGLLDSTKSPFEVPGHEHQMRSATETLTSPFAPRLPCSQSEQQTVLIT